MHIITGLLALISAYLIGRVLWKCIDLELERMIENFFNEN